MDIEMSASSVSLVVNTRMFPIQSIEYALCTLNDHLVGQITKQDGEYVTVQLASLKTMTEESIRRMWNQALSATSVNGHTCQTSAPLHNDLAQTALSSSTASQQTLDELAARHICQRDIEHARVLHMNTVLSTKGEVDPSPLRVVQIENEAGVVIVSFNLNYWLLPNALLSIHRLRDTYAEFVLDRPGNSLIVNLRPMESETRLDSVIEQFEPGLIP